MSPNIRKNLPAIERNVKQSYQYFDNELCFLLNQCKLTPRLINPEVTDEIS
jgi:hypothetical protein